MKIIKHSFRWRNLIVLALYLSSCGQSDFSSDYFAVKEVHSGNAFLLVNGYKVSLIGIEDNPQTLNYLTNHLLGRKVRFVFDSQSPVYRISQSNSEKAFSAYVIMDNGLCLNSHLLKS